MGGRFHLACLIVALLGQAGISHGQEEYLDDGVLSARGEEFRWLANRARFDHAAENTLRGTSWPAQPSRPPMAPNAKIIQTAQHHAVDMATRNSFIYETVEDSAFFPWKDHRNNPRLDLLERLDFVGYPSNLAAQINAGGAPSGAAMFDQLWQQDSSPLFMLSYAREFGAGFSPRIGSSTFSNYEVVMVGQTTNPRDFFTDTLYHDANGNNTYNTGEGVGGVRIRLSVNGTEYEIYDLSVPAGSFAVPLKGISGGSTVSVFLVNEGKDRVTLSIPRTHSTHMAVTLESDEVRQLGTFTHVAGSNVGLRNMTIPLPLVVPVLSVNINAARKPVIAWQSSAGQFYVVQWSPDLKEPWTNLQPLPVSGTGGTLSMEDPAVVSGPLRRFYRVVTGRP